MLRCCSYVSISHKHAGTDPGIFNLGAQTNFKKKSRGAWVPDRQCDCLCKNKGVQDCMPGGTPESAPDNHSILIFLSIVNNNCLFGSLQEFDGLTWPYRLIWLHYCSDSIIAVSLKRNCSAPRSGFHIHLYNIGCILNTRQKVFFNHILISRIKCPSAVSRGPNQASWPNTVNAWRIDVHV